MTTRVRDHDGPEGEDGWHSWAKATRCPRRRPQVLTFGAPSVGEILAERYQLEEHIGNDSLGRQLYRGIDVILRRPVAVVLRYPGRRLAPGRCSAPPSPRAASSTRTWSASTTRSTRATGPTSCASGSTGIALREIVERRARWTPPRSVAVAWAVTDAVAALHATGMAHGNIHPGTVLVAARRPGRADRRARRDAATPETDIRSIGAILYCSLTGYWPHAEVGPVVGARRRARQQRCARSRPGRSAAGMPTHLDALAADLLNPDLPLPPADALAGELASSGSPRGHRLRRRADPERRRPARSPVVSTPSTWPRPSRSARPARPAASSPSAWSAC